MIKKLLTIFVLPILIILLLTSCTSIEKEYPALKWFPEKSHFLDYKIEGHVVTFRYKILFKNFTNEDIAVGITAIFEKSYTKDWVEENEFLATFSKSDNDLKDGYAVVKANNSTYVIASFSGTFTGGKVNTNLSFPEEIILITV